jgi:quercetin dioxygenase-like cupin family protein
MTGNGSIFRRVAEGTPNQALDMPGPAVEFLTGPDPQGSFCVMRGVLPPGITVPVHSHDDAEDFLVLTGTHQVRMQGADGLEWVHAHVGDYVHIPAGTPHAHRNTSACWPWPACSRRPGRWLAGGSATGIRSRRRDKHHHPFG